MPELHPIPNRPNFRDLTGQRFGRLLVVGYKGSGRVGKSQHSSLWLCRCDCGTEVTVPGPYITCGDKQSCGCMKKESRVKDLADMRFGRLLVTSFDRVEGNATYWRCHCDCGKDAVVAATQLRSGKTRSCGCLRSELSAERKRTHGRSDTRECRIWRGIKRRCYEEAEESYAGYGAKGIVMCARWRESFPSFLADMGEQPSSKHTVDRIRQDGNYSCGHCEECKANGWEANCRWATAAEQNRNKSTNR